MFEMNTENQLLLEQLYQNRISMAEFERRADPALRLKNSYVMQSIEAAMESADAEALDEAVVWIWRTEDPNAFIDILNELMIRPMHRSHQAIVKMLQFQFPSPKSIPFVRRALASNFDYLEYTGSDSDAIAKWFSWLLYAIGTEEAIEEMRAFSYSADQGIANEMRYRLQKIPGHQSQ